MTTPPEPATKSAYTVQQTAAHFANRVEAVRRSNRATAGDLLSLDQAAAFLRRVATDDLAVFEATVDAAWGIPPEGGEQP